jgi:hypothetical protein
MRGLLPDMKKDSLHAGFCRRRIGEHSIGQGKGPSEVAAVEGMPRRDAFPPDLLEQFIVHRGLFEHGKLRRSGEASGVPDARDTMPGTSQRTEQY